MVTSDIFNSLASIILEVRLFVSNSQIPRILVESSRHILIYIITVLGSLHSIPLKLYNYSSNDFSFFNSLAGLLFFGSSQLFSQLMVTSELKDTYTY